MVFRALTLCLTVATAALLLAACQGTSSQPAAPSTVGPTAGPTAVSSSTPAAAPTAAPTPSSAEAPSPLPTPTMVPAATPATETSAAATDVSDSNGAAEQSPSNETTDEPAEDPAPVTAPPPSKSEAPDAVFHQRDGLTLEYYWPLDTRGFLSADETEILAYNESDETIEFTALDMTFLENGKLLAKISGTWEKFGSRNSWDRIEYIMIPPSSYDDAPLLVYPGEKAKIHWHVDPIASADSAQSVVLDLTFAIGTHTEKITDTLWRDPENRVTGYEAVAAAATGPTDSGSHDTEHSTPSDVTTESEVIPSSSRDDEHSTTDNAPVVTSHAASDVLWRFDGSTWAPNVTPPDCSDPLSLQTPVDMDLVTSALWPGQVRGGYKGHGGFRFGASEADSVTIRTPLSSHLVQASRYLEGNDEQYLLFFSVPCGFFYRFDHVRVLSAELSDALKDLPPPMSGDSRTTFVSPPLWLEQGEVVGTSVGIFPDNIFVDFGLYDVRKPNNVVPNPAWADFYAGDPEFGHYGVCFFDYLPGNDGETMRSLPTGKEGKTSDYCE